MEREPRQPDSDLESAFEYCGIEGVALKDIVDVLAAVYGEHDGADYHWITKLADGRFAYITGGCDYTGWDCQASAKATVFSTLESAVNAVPEHEEFYASRGNIRQHIQKQLDGTTPFGCIDIKMDTKTHETL